MQSSSDGECWNYNFQTSRSYSDWLRQTTPPSHFPRLMPPGSAALRPAALTKDPVEYCSEPDTTLRDSLLNNRQRREEIVICISNFRWIASQYVSLVSSQNYLIWSSEAQSLPPRMEPCSAPAYATSHASCALSIAYLHLLSAVSRLWISSGSLSK